MHRQNTDERRANRKANQQPHTLFILRRQKGETAFLADLQFHTRAKSGGADTLIAPNSGFALKDFTVIFQIPQRDSVFDA